MTKSILLVEDSVFDAELTLRTLRSIYPTTETLHALDGEQALAALQKNAFVLPASGGIGLILLDLKLPEVDGFEVLKSIRSSPLLQDVPVVVISSSSSPADQTRAKLLGATHFLMKSAEPEFAALMHLALEPLRGSFIAPVAGTA